MSDLWDEIDVNMKSLRHLHSRMDDSRDLVYQEPFTLKKYNSNEPLTNVINVTGNQAVVFANSMMLDLMDAKWQTKVEGNISKTQKTEIERFIDDNFLQADENITNTLGIDGLYSFHCSHVCVRSLIGAMWVSQVIGNEYLINALPVDMRWCAHKFGKYGLDWVAPIYFKTHADIKDDYPSMPLLGDLSDELELRDYWNSYSNIPMAGTNEKMTGSTELGRIEQQNPFGFVPFVIVYPPSGFMLRDKGYLEHESPDIFMLNKNIYDELNRALSIEQTIGMDSVFPPYEYETDNYDSTPPRPVPKPGETKKVPKGELHQPVPRGDINRAYTTAREDIYRMIELGGVSDAELGNAGLDRPGVWFAKQWEIRMKFQGARLRALTRMKEGLARMMIKEFIINTKGNNSEFRIGMTGSKNRFKAKNLGNPDDYRITFIPHITSKEMEIVNIAQAQGARGIIPEPIIIRDILKAAEPEVWVRELEMEKAKMIDPSIALAEMAVRYAEEGDFTSDPDERELKYWQSKMLVHNYVMLMKAKMRQDAQPSPQPEGQPPTQGGNGANMNPLASVPKMMGSGGLMGGQAQRATQQAQQTGNIPGGLR